MNPADLALPHITRLHAYTPGLQPTEPGWVKLNTNECPYAPSPRVAEAIRTALGADGDRLRLYPNPTSAPLRATIARFHGVDTKQVLVGNGSDDVLNLLVRAFAGPEAAIGFTLPSYSLYPVLVGIQDGGTTTIPFDRSMRLPVAAIHASNAKAFFLTSPNAPTGVGFSADEIETVLRGFSGLLVVDEAYAAFASGNAVGLLSRYPNLVVVRTLSKAYALAGLRVGYALAHPSVIGILDRVRDSYNVSHLSQVGAIAALEDTDYYQGVVQKIKQTRDFYGQELASRGWFTYESAANFLFTEPRNASGVAAPEVALALFKHLWDAKILVRHFPNHALTAPFLRISVGSDDEMLTLLEAIDAWIQLAK